MILQLLICSMLISGDAGPQELVAVSQQVGNLAAADTNRLRSFTPRVTSENANGTRRHTPLLFVESPWTPAGAFALEVPEYTWVRVPGDPHSGDPFFYGRQVGVNQQWHVRYPSLESPRWKDCGKGCLALDVPLTGGYVQRFRVLAKDRVVEVRFGITNNSAQPLTNVRCQICLQSSGVKTLAERWPTSSKFYSQGKILTWDSLGQDLSWLNSFLRANSDQFTQSCFFLAPLRGHEPRDYPEKKRAREDLMWFNRPIDVPAIAKVGDGGSAIIVYSPHGHNAFYNVLVPCFHADPRMNAIAPKETRWTSSYLILFEGDLDEFFKNLTALHKSVASDEGYLDTQIQQRAE